MSRSNYTIALDLRVYHLTFPTLEYFRWIFYGFFLQTSIFIYPSIYIQLLNSEQMKIMNYEQQKITSHQEIFSRPSFSDLSGEKTRQNISANGCEMAVSQSARTPSQYLKTRFTWHANPDSKADTTIPCSHASPRARKVFKNKATLCLAGVL